MSWAFIVVRDNTVERVKVFSDFWDGADYTDAFIKNIDPNFNGNLPAYNRNENYKNGDLTVGLYRENHQ
jgi:hypothetical protein